MADRPLAGEHPHPSPASSAATALGPLLLPPSELLHEILLRLAVPELLRVRSVARSLSGRAQRSRQVAYGPTAYNIKAYLPVIESFGFSSQLRAATSGQAFPQCVFDHWDMMGSDPLEAGSQAAQLVLDIRKRKGLKEQMTPLSEFEDKL
ncbi:elongation factor 2-like [Miscanthus floridulus]|uniref:elongation factor 2-like n=1 Tax=Miscanthus floridulus TaxID=154761 RepID=UPI003458FD13